jgi:hypothetical protein
MSTGTNKERISANNEIISENNADLTALKTRINNLPTSGDTTATAEDIAVGKTAVSKGVKLTGTMQPGIDTSDATATVDDIAVNKSAYVKGQKLIGTLSKVNSIVGQGIIVENPNNVQFRYTNPTRKILEANKDITLYSPNANVANAIGLTADKLKKDEVVLGITGTYEGEGGTTVPDWSEIGYSSVPSSLLDMFAYSKNIYDNWDSTQTNLGDKYSGNEEIRYMPLVDTSRATKTGNMFRGAINLIEVPELNLSKVTTAYQMFYNARGLIKVSYLNLSRVTNMQDMFAYCNALNNESLNNILAMCANATAYIQQGTNMTLRYIGLSSIQASNCQRLSNWDAFVAAGWTTGY